MKVSVNGDHSASFVLHSYPFRETSVIIEAFTRTHGRMVFVAKGAKRPTGTMRGLLNPFQGLALSWFGKSDMKTLKRVEHARIFTQLRGEALMSAFYLNEIVLKLTHREDAHEVLFDAYETAVEKLCAQSKPGFAADAREIEIALRGFELTLLEELGYALPIKTELDSGAPIRADATYLYLHERGATAVNGTRAPTIRSNEYGQPDGLQLRGKTLIDVAARDFSDAITLQQSKQLMRGAINALLGEKSLHTRQLIRDLREI